MLALVLPLLARVEDPSHDAKEINILNQITLGQIVVVLAGAGVIVGFFKMVNPVLRRLNDLMDDWFGEPARPGVPERKGVMERQEMTDAASSAQSAAITAQGEALEALLTKVEPLIDPKADGNHQEVLRRLTEINILVTTNHGDLNALKRLLGRHIRESRAWVEAVDVATAERNFTTPPWPNLPDDEEDDGRPPSRRP